MNTEYEIFKLLNGEYDRANLKELFGKMSYDSALMNDFLGMLSLKTSSLGSVDFQQPDANVKSALMAKLDFNSSGKSARTIFPLSFFANGFKYLITAALASLITYLLMMNFAGNSVKEIGSANTAKVEFSKQSGAKEKNSILEIRKENNDVSGNIFKHKSKTALPGRRIVDFSIVPENSRQPENSSNPDNSSPNFSTYPVQSVIIRDVPSQANPQNISAHDFFIPLNIDAISELKTYGVNVEIIMNEDWHIPSATITPEEFQPFNNSCLAISYLIADHLAIGADVRRENFFERYEGRDPLDKLYKFYSQTENSVNYGLFARYSYQLNDYFSPYVQSGFGISSTGPIIRFGSGLAFYPVDYFGLTVSAEYSRLFFKHISTQFYTEKAGLRIGIIKEF